MVMKQANTRAKSITEHFIDLEWLVVAVLILVILLQGIATITQLSITSEEPAYLTTGYIQLVTGDRELGLSSDPPLLKYIISLPLFFRDVNISPPAGSINTANDYSSGSAVLFEFGNDHRSIAFWGRFMILMLSVLLAVFVYLWARQLFGVVAGIFALFLYAFEPSIIAHSTLATTDFGVAVFMFISTYFAWRFFLERSLKLAAAAGVFFGMALASKMTAVLLIPVFLIQAWMYRDPRAAKVISGKPASRVAGLALIIAGAFFALWAAYGFELSAIGSPAVSFQGDSNIAKAARDQLRLVPEGLFKIPLPASSWLKTAIWQKAQTSVGHSTYLFGQYSGTGWWYYSLIAFLIKTTVPLLLLIFIGSYLYFRVLKDRDDRTSLILVPVIVFAWSAINKVDIGIRHILPALPFLIVFASQITTFGERLPKWHRPVIAILCVWLVISALVIFPDFLAYFNELIGGPSNGHKYLVDSDLDWGQGLIQVRDYMEANDLGVVKFSYFGSVNPGVYGIFLKPLSQEETLRPQKDVYLISVTNLYDVDSRDHQAWSWARYREPTARIGRSVFVYDLREE